MALYVQFICVWYAYIRWSRCVLLAHPHPVAVPLSPCPQLLPVSQPLSHL